MQDNYRIIPLEEANPDSTIVIANRYHDAEIERQLKENGYSGEQIINLGRIIDEEGEKQYFDLPYLRRDEEEVFVDAGAFNGRTSILFSEWAGIFKHIYSFEADKGNAIKCRNNLSQSFQEDMYSVINKALGAAKGEICFSGSKEGSSQISDNEELCTQFMKTYTDKFKQAEKEYVEMTTLDDEIQDDVTFIKMDIEGAELDALKGGKEIIERCKPKLAISIYHRPMDIFDIPSLIINNNKEYTLYLRHYSIFNTETVLYAV